MKHDSYDLGETNVDAGAIPVFHVGYPKSGSTSLQLQVLSRLGGYYAGLIPTAQGPVDPVLAESPYFQLTAIADFYQEVFMTDNLEYDRYKAKSLLQEILDDADNKRIMFSHERGIGAFCSAFPDPVVKAERLKDLFGELRVIIIIREQISALKSQYRDHPFEPHDPKHGRPVSFEVWLKLLQNQKHYSLLNLLKYDRTCQVYANLFGAPNVLVLPLELMKHDPAEFALRLARFLGADLRTIVHGINSPPENVGGSQRLNAWRKFRRKHGWLRVGKIAPGFIKHGILDALKSGSPEHLSLHKELEEQLARTYALSNARCQSDWNLDLNALGYKM